MAFTKFDGESNSILTLNDLYATVNYSERCFYLTLHTSSSRCAGFAVHVWDTGGRQRRDFDIDFIILF
jgi:hypothetical protein